MKTLWLLRLNSHFLSHGTKGNMEFKDKPVSGGVSILHSYMDGKHHYEVETVLKDKNAKNILSMRRGDKLLKINGLDLEGLPPDKFAEMLSEDSPMLTIHQSSPDSPVKTIQEPGMLCPYKKEDFYVDLCLNMFEESDVCGSEDGEVEGNEMDNDILLLVEMLDTNMSVVRGRGCKHGETCKDCGGTDCSLDELVIMSVRTSLVSRGISDFLRNKVQENIALESLRTNMFVSLSGNKTQLKPKSAKITIYYYQSDHVDGAFKGVPVVLNFSGTDKFLRCGKHADTLQTIIDVMPYNKERLKCISKEDHESLAFVFYMKGGHDGGRMFESAHCEGWFIHSTERHLMTTRLKPLDDSFYFIIRGKMC